jgi:hypothetical protein
MTFYDRTEEFAVLAFAFESPYLDVFVRSVFIINSLLYMFPRCTYSEMKLPDRIFALGGAGKAIVYEILEADWIQEAVLQPRRLPDYASFWARQTNVSVRKLA